MSTVAAGLFDNDAAIARLPRFTKIDPKPSLMAFLTSRAVQLWFAEIDGSTFARSVERRSKEVISLPKPLFDALSYIARNPKLTDKGSRTAAHRAILGGSKNGFRIEPLFAMPEAKSLVEPLSETLATRLDRNFKAKHSFLEDPLTELGILLELTNAGIFQREDRVQAWERGFMNMSERTTEDRPHWDEFVAKVRPAFPALLKP